MGTTLTVERIGRTAVTAIELVHSPDDGGYYLSNVDFRNNRSRVSEAVYPTEEAARADLNGGTVKWEPWY